MTPTLDWPKLRTRKLMLASPLYANSLLFGYHQSVLQLALSCQRSGVAMGIKCVGCDSLVPRARNRLAAHFLDSDATDLLFVDADISFRAEDALSLLQLDEPIVGGVYPRKQLDWTRIARAARAGVAPGQLPHYGFIPVMNWGGQGDYPLHSLFEVRHLGTGFLRIRRDVFTTLIDNGSAIAYDQSSDEIAFAGRTGHDFFPTGPDPRYPVGSGGRQYLSEDWAFCELARAAGFQLWTAPWIELTHSGYMDYSGSLDVMDAALEAALDASTT
jgi:hypothetical protein